MVSRNCSGPYEVVCVTDDPAGIDSSVRIVSLWDDYASVPSPVDRGGARKNPSCYRRLKMFAADAASWAGERILSMDLDIVITGDIYGLGVGAWDFAAFGDTHPTTFYNGGLIALRAGSRTKVWDEFDPVTSPQKGLAMRQFGSDQAWIGACLGAKERKFGADDGVYSYRCYVRPNGMKLPNNARVVLFHGAHDPWGHEAQGLEWVRRNWK